jgi:SAM-dependent methyltransferase
MGAVPIPAFPDFPSGLSSALSTVQRELIGLLRCPHDGTPLSGWDGVSQTGALTSPNRRTYPVRDGIPCLLPDSLRDTAPPETDPVADEFGEKRREMQARDQQAGEYDRMLGLKLFTSAELPLSLRYLWPEPSHLLLEGGCGTGRMTGAFTDAVRGTLAVDFSQTSLCAARAKLSPQQARKVLFVQADLSQLPVASHAFDRVGSFGVYEHIPTPEARDKAVGEMKRVLKKREYGGRWAMSAYRWGPPQSWTSQREGHHAGGIYFRRFSLSELKGLVAPHFDIGGATESLLYYHLLWGRPRS